MCGGFSYFSSKFYETTNLKMDEQELADLMSSVGLELDQDAADQDLDTLREQFAKYVKAFSLSFSFLFFCNA